MTIHIIAMLYNDEGPNNYRLAMVVPCVHDTVVPAIGDTVTLYNNSRNLGRVKVVERNFQLHSISLRSLRTGLRTYLPSHPRNLNIT